MVPVMIGSPPAKNSITFRSLVLNNATDDEKDTYAIEEVDISPAWNQSFEPLPDRDGSQGYEPLEMYKMLHVRGWVRGQSLAELYDKIETINKTFHPVNCYLADSATVYNRGYMALDFDVPTEDTSNYPTGKIASRYYVQALGLPVTLDTKFDGFSARIDFFLRAIDPRRYLQSTSSANRTGTGNITVDNSLASIRSWPTITIVTATSPTGTYTIATSEGDQVVSINAADLASDTSYTLDMQARRFYKTSDGTDMIASIDSGSEFFDILAKSQTITVTTAASVSTTVTWRRAFT
jgi:hypothetical protein